MIDIPEALQNFRAMWERKPILRVIYDDFYNRHCRILRARRNNRDRRRRRQPPLKRQPGGVA